MEDTYSFGYPRTCNDCAELGDKTRRLCVAPYFKSGGPFRLMLVGQDPTVRKKPDRVKHVLMLDQPGSKLARWLREVFGGEILDRVTLYATNVVKCSFSAPPSSKNEGGLQFLRPYAEKCQRYLKQEVASFKPSVLITLGEPAHKIFRSILDKPENVAEGMQTAFTGEFQTVSIAGTSFDYSPCLHLQTFRVAEVYGPRIPKFKNGLADRLRAAGLGGSNYGAQ